MKPVFLLSKKLLLLLAIPLLLCLLIITAGVLQFFGGSQNTQEDPTLTISPTLLPEVTPQAFRVGEDRYTKDLSKLDIGSLVVTTNVADAWAYIDPSDTDEHSEAPVTKSAESSYKQVPPQYPPFRIEKIPVGKHRLIVAKADYIAEDLSFTIKKGETTTLHVVLERVSGL